MIWTGSAVLIGALIVLIALAVATLNTAAKRQRAEAWRVHTYNVLLVVSELNAALNVALRSERGYLITADEAFLMPYATAKDQAPELAGKLQSLTRDNPRQQRMSGLLGHRMELFFQTLEQAIDRARSGHAQDAFRLVRNWEGRDRAELVFDVLRQIEREERRLLEARLERQLHVEQRGEIFRFAMIGFGVLLVLTATGVSLMALDAHVRALDANRELERIATTDALTSLQNRRSFLEELERVAIRSGRSGSPYSLAMFDIDFFKKINDTYGHPAGDEVLRSVAQIMRDAVRGGDVVGRLGGEEFALLMPDTALADAGSVCERVRKSVEAFDFTLPSGVSIRATVSAGTAQAQTGELASSAVSRADAALYAAKRDGRNRVNHAA